MFKKLTFGLVLASFLFTLILFPFAEASKAAEATEPSTWYSQSFPEWARKVFDSDNEDEIFGERYTAAQVMWILFSFIGHPINWVLGNELFSCALDNDFHLIPNCSAQLADRFSQANSNTQPEPVASSNFFVDYINSNSVSGVGYIANSIRRFNPHLIPEANAQGYGYNVFPQGSIFRQLWSTVRDVSYFIVVLAVVYISFLIMFRSKTSPQTAITVQAALPKIVMTLILITFSYAIAGFMIDFMYVLIGIVAMIIKQSHIVMDATTWTTLFNFLTTGPYELGIFGYFFYFFYIFIITSITALFQVMLSPSLPAFIVGLMGIFLIPLMILILIVVFFLAMFRAIITIVKTYVNIILNIVGAPIILAIGLAIPSVGFGSWFTTLLSNLMVFPAISVMAMLAIVLALAAGGVLGAIGSNFFSLASLLSGIISGQNLWAPLWDVHYFDQSDALGWMPPLSLGAYGQAGQENYFAPLLLVVASLSVLLMIPKAADIVKSLFARKPYPYGTAIGEGLGPLVAGYALGRGFVGDQLGAAGRAGYAAIGGPNWNQIATNVVGRFAKPGSTPPTFTGGGKTRTGSGKSGSTTP